MACTLLLIVSAVVLLLYHFVKSRLAKLTVSGKEHKYVLVTGCDTGFGNRLALHLDSIGVPVFAGCLTEAGLSELRKQASSRLHAIALDVTSTESRLKAFEYVKQTLPTPDAFWGLVNNAGILGTDGPLEFHTLKENMDMFQVNFFGMVEMTTTFLPLLKKSRGRIVNVSSIAGIVAMPAYAAYSASKWAIFGWSEALRREKAPWGIKVAILAPGGYPTNITQNMPEKKQAKWESLPKEIREEYGEDYLEADKAKFDKSLTLITNSDLMDVVKAHQHALFSRYPQIVYFIGKDAFIFNIFSFLPRALVDLIWIYGIAGAQPKCLRK